MKAVLKKIFLFLAATALLLYISAGTAYLTYSLHLKGSPLFYASEALEIAVFACVVPFAREAALRVGIKSACSYCREFTQLQQPSEAFF